MFVSIWCITGMCPFYTIKKTLDQGILCALNKNVAIIMPFNLQCHRAVVETCLQLPNSVSIYPLSFENLHFLKEEDTTTTSRVFRVLLKRPKLQRLCIFAQVLTHTYHVFFYFLRKRKFSACGTFLRNSLLKNK